MAEGDIDVAAAQAALDAAGGMPETVPSQGSLMDPHQTGASEPAAAPVAEPVTPDDAATPEGTVDEDPFTSIDDSALSEELKQMKRSLQADYTRKTQEAAPWRKLGEELGVDDPNSFRDALTVYQRLQNPANWPTISSELSEYMQQYGMSPAQANAAANAELSQMAPLSEPDDSDFGEEDSGYAPAINALQQQISQLTNMLTTQQQQAAEQAQLQSVGEHLTRQEQALTAANPHYEQGDWEAIYSLLGNDGDLVAAQQKYESLIGTRVAKYIQGKSSVAAQVPSAPQGGTVISEEGTKPMTPDDYHRAAMAHIAELDRSDATS